MKGLFLVEPVVVLVAFCGFLVSPLSEQYVYRRLWKQVTNTSFPVLDNASRCARNESSNQSDYQEEVQRQASLFFVYSELASTIPSLVVTLMLVAYSDRGGRKITIIMPLTGMLLYCLVYLTVSYFELNIYLLIGGALLSSLCGGAGTLTGGCFAYIADLCEDNHQKTMRIAGVDMTIGLFSGVASICSGYFLRAAGFNWPFLTSSLGMGLALFYTIFILEESMKPPDGFVVLEASRLRAAVTQMVFGVYQMFTRVRCEFKMSLALLITIYTIYNLTYAGGSTSITLYELNEPLCWTEILIGYSSAVYSAVFVTSFLGVLAFSYCGLKPLHIVRLGILSLASGMFLASFAKTTPMMFTGMALLLLSVMPFPVLRAMLSEITAKSEQGALFAFLSFVGILSNGISIMVFKSVYAASVTWYPGLVFLLSALVCLVSLVLACLFGMTDAVVPREIDNPETENREESPLLG
ncbi:lysosomal proton-coupled steroid conjugate and bile acid symporter SLC46A3-like [Pholidichthys leucotaenia]